MFIANKRPLCLEATREDLQLSYVAILLRGQYTSNSEILNYTNIVIKHQHYTLLENITEIKLIIYEN